MNVGAAVTVMFLGGGAAAAFGGDSDLARVRSAQERWDAIGATVYSYDLGKGIGSPFGYGQFHVRVNNGKCRARHFAGVGFGRPKFSYRWFYRTCKDLLPGDLMSQVIRELQNGRQLVKFQTDPKFGLGLSAETDNDKFEDASWGYEITSLSIKRTGHGT